MHAPTPPTILDHSWVAGYQSLAHDHLACCDLVSERQHNANDLFAKCILWRFLVWNGETQPFRTLCVKAPNFVVGN